MDILCYVCGIGLVVLYKEEVNKSKNCIKKLIDGYKCLV